MTTLTNVTARCVHCAWRTDTERGQALDEVRSVHELLHPGGTVLVGEEPATNGNGLGTCTKKGCGRQAVERIGRGYASYCQEHLDEYRAIKAAAGRRGAARNARRAVPPPAKGQPPARNQRAVAPEPAPEQASKPSPEGTLVALARAVEEAQERLAVAREDLDAAVDAMREALEAVG